MSKARATKASIVEQAAPLFNRQGYAGASMSDVMRATGLQKGGIYNHFRSKEELALAAFDRSVERLQQRFMGALRGKRQTVERLLAFLDIYEHLLDEPFFQGGCPILNTAVESDDTNPALRSRAQQAMDAWRSLFQRLIARGIARGELRAELDAEATATILIATLEGAIMLTKLYGDPIHLRRAIAHLKTYIYDQLANRR